MLSFTLLPDVVENAISETNRQEFDVNVPPLQLVILSERHVGFTHDPSHLIRLHAAAESP
jgi:hypothetical protein